MIFQTTRELLVNETDLGALTLVGPTRQYLVLDPYSSTTHRQPTLHL